MRDYPPGIKSHFGGDVKTVYYLTMILVAYPDVVFTYYKGNIEKWKIGLSPFDIYSNLRGGF
jgi:hypothetical protein